MSRFQHGIRIVLLMACAAALFGWKASHTDILFADGLRYIRQAQQIEQGALVHGLFKAVDHPVYPLSIAGAHRVLGGDGPEAWQAAGQLASVLAGILLVVPFYLITVELFGARAGWLGGVLSVMVPLSSSVAADVLSESTFLLFWTWGLWTALRFLREGTFLWLPATVFWAALAYLTRPEGLLLPAALVASLGLMPLMRSTRLNWPRWRAAVGFLVIGPAILVGPYIVTKGGLGTKPAIARLLGTAPRSAPDAVERNRPLEREPLMGTYAHALKAVFEAVRDAVTIPLLPLAAIGLVIGCRDRSKARLWLFVWITLGASLLALVRLHATGGYCSPRHALIPGMLLIAAAGFGLDFVLRSLSVPERWFGLGTGRVRPGPAFWLFALVGLGAIYMPQVLMPLNQDYLGYREASEWLAEHVDRNDEKVVDVTGWTLFYGEQNGYTFSTLISAWGDPEARWVVAREAHIHGPWMYCHRIRQLIDDLKPVATFPLEPIRGQARIQVFDRKLEGEDRLAGTENPDRITR